jgi:hypothetical protein
MLSNKPSRTSKPRAFRAQWAGVCAVTGNRYLAGAEIYRNPNGPGYVEVRVEVPARFKRVSLEGCATLEQEFGGDPWTDTTHPLHGALTHAG